MERSEIKNRVSRGYKCSGKSSNHLEQGIDLSFLKQPRESFNRFRQSPATRVLECDVVESKEGRKRKKRP
jgi:hypothetical protein